MEKQASQRHEQLPLLIVISGPAGVGKDTVIKRLREVGPPLHFVVTATDRAPRPDEIDGVDYIFVSTEEFLRMERAGELLEHALVYGQHKGVPREQVRAAMASGKDVIMRVDVQGAQTIRQIAPEAVLVFLTALEEELVARLERRGADSPEQVATRLKTFREEMTYLDIFDYIVFNREGHIERAVEDVTAIITAEHCCVDHREVSL